MNIVKMLVATNKYGIKCPYSMNPTRIVVHNTANDASARNEVQYMIGNNNQVSFHYAVDDKEIVQGIPENRNAWHAGDGNGKGNREGLSVEICYSKSGGDRFIKAEQNAAKFIAELLKARGWGIDKVTKHQDYSGKYCPHRTLDMGWQRFLNMVSDELEGGSASSGSEQPKPSTPSISKPVSDEINVVHQANAQGKGWQSEVTNYNNTNSNGYSGWMGKPIVAFRAKTKGDADEVGYLEYRAHRKGGGWYGWRRDYNKDSAGDTFAGDGKNPIDGLQFRLVGLSGKNVRYRVHCIGKGWLDWVTNYGSGANGYAGWYGYAIDAVQIEVV